MNNTYDKRLTIANVTEKEGKKGKYLLVKDTRGDFYQVFGDSGASISQKQQIFSEFMPDITINATIAERDFNGKTYKTIVGLVYDEGNTNEPEKTFDQIKQEQISHGQSWNLATQVALSLKEGDLKLSILEWQKWFEEQLNK